METAVGLLARAVPLRPNLWAVLTAHLLGVGGHRPISAGVAAEAAGYTRSWLRDLLGQVRALALATGPPPSVLAGVALLQDGPVRTVKAARAALAEAGVTTTGVHPAGVLRVAEVVGAPCTAEVLTLGDSDEVAVIVPTG